MIATLPLVWVIPPWKTMTALAPLMVPPFTVTRPTMVLLFVPPVREKVPPEPSVVPLTVKAGVPVVSVPELTVRLPEIVKPLVACVTVPPLIIIFPPTVESGAVAVPPLAVKLLFIVVMDVSVFVPLPLIVRL